MLVKNDIEKVCYELKTKLIYLRVNYFFFSRKHLESTTSFFLKVHDMEFAPSLDIIINETLPALQKVQQSGKARFIGITGYPLGNFRYKTLCLSSLFLLLSFYFFQFFFYKIILNWGNLFLKLYYIFKNIVYDRIF